MIDPTLIADGNERRRFKRFNSKAFVGVQLNVIPLPPFFGKPLDGELLDISACGMAIGLNELIPEKTKLKLMMLLPDHSCLKSDVVIRRALIRERGYMVGVEFLTLPPYMQDKIDRMANDYLECERRIRRKDRKVCDANCAFFNSCTKPQKTTLLHELDVTYSTTLKKAS